MTDFSGASIDGEDQFLPTMYVIVMKFGSNLLSGSDKTRSGGRHLVPMLGLSFGTAKQRLCNR
ncbi:MAG: hypothetical protein EBY21_06475 [Alphaproteobacteria bacterium]|nr:hypothetical protein [Alphaproteobacteria bacterium]